MGIDLVIQIFSSVGMSDNVFFYLFITSFLLLLGVSFFFLKTYKNKIKEMKTQQQQHTAKIDTIRKEHSDVLENIRIEMLRKEEDRNRQWMESEKETLHVLNGVSQLLEISDKFGRIESENILNKLDELKNLIIERKNI